MHLNADCVRDTLLYLEEELTIDYQTKQFNQITIKDAVECIMLKHTAYSAEEIWYVIYNLQQIHFIEGNFSNAGSHKMVLCNIENITWNGHQFLNTIRPNTIWEATKNKAREIGGMSINTLSTVASSIMQSIATNPDFIQSIINSFTQS